MLDEVRDRCARRNNADPPAGKLKIGLIPTVGPDLLPRVMQKNRRHYRSWAHGRRVRDEPLQKRLREGDIDPAIMALPAEQEGWESRARYEEAFTYALPNGHPRARNSTIRRPISRTDAAASGGRDRLRDQALEVRSRVDVREAEDFG